MTITANIPEAFKELLQEQSRFKVFYGGRGSGKSWAFADSLLIISCYKTIRVLCTREIQKSIADSVYQLLVDAIDRLGLKGQFKITDKNIINLKTDSKFIFLGLYRNIDKVQSIEGIDYCWVEEGQSISYKSWKKLEPSIRKDDSEVWVSFNPEKSEDVIYNMFVDSTPPKKSIVKKVNWRDNPYFPEVLKNSLEWEKANNYDDYLWIWEGNLRRVSDALILKNKYIVKEFKHEEIQKSHNKFIPLYSGVDYGYSPDPFAIVRCFIHDRCLWVDYEAGGVSLEVPQYLDEFLKIPDVHKCRIATDHNYKSITAMFQKYTSLSVHFAKKGPGSVNDNIKFLRQFDKIVFHPRCMNIINEAGLWSFKIDKNNDEPTTVEDDKHNHWINALQYAISHLRDKFIKKRYQQVRVLGVR